MSEKVTVYVIQEKDRANLTMRYRDPGDQMGSRPDSGRRREADRSNQVGGEGGGSLRWSPRPAQSILQSVGPEGHAGASPAVGTPPPHHHHHEVLRPYPGR